MLAVLQESPLFSRVRFRQLELKNTAEGPVDSLFEIDRRRRISCRENYDAFRLLSPCSAQCVLHITK